MRYSTKLCLWLIVSLLAVNSATAWKITPELEKELAEKLFALRLQRVTGQLESPAKMRQAKRDLARVLTVLREKRD